MLGAALAAATVAPPLHRGPVPRRRRLRHGRAVRGQGAPDLALTQVAIETLTTVLFVLVLRRLPDRFESRGAAVAPVDPARRAGAVGLTVFVLRAGDRRAATRRRPSSDAIVERSLPDGGGKQRRQRDPGRLPGLRHARRDHRAGRRGHRHGRARPGRPAAQRAPTASRTGRPRRAATGAGRPAGHARGVGAGACSPS